MKYYGEGSMILVMKNRAQFDYAPVPYHVTSKKRNNTYVFIIKERNLQII